MRFQLLFSMPLAGRFLRTGTASALASLCVALLAGGGCASSDEQAMRDSLTANVGRYDPPPSGLQKPRVGVPPFRVTESGGASASTAVNELVADQMTTLLDQSERFTVIERAQLNQLLQEQNLGAIIKPGELAGMSQVRGVDYLLLGRVTDLRVKRESSTTGFGFGRFTGWLGFGGADYKKENVQIKTDCGVDIRLVNPSSGEVFASNFSEFSRVDSVSAFGLDILGASAQSDADLSISEDDKGKILRLALDDALRKMLPKIDQKLKSLPPASPPTGG